MENDMKPKVITLGQIVATPGVIDACNSATIARALDAHMHGDWGVVCDEDKASNDAALVHGDRVLSAYPIDPDKPCKGHGDNTLWVITEADRSVTTLLLPEEY
jgi:hypothetical protein